MPLDGATPPLVSSMVRSLVVPGLFPLCWAVPLAWPKTLTSGWPRQMAVTHGVEQTSEDLESRDGSFATPVPYHTIPCRPFCSPPTFSEPPGTHTQGSKRGSARYLPMWARKNHARLGAPGRSFLSCYLGDESGTTLSAGALLAIAVPLTSACLRQEHGWAGGLEPRR